MPEVHLRPRTELQRTTHSFHLPDLRHACDPKPSKRRRDDDSAADPRDQLRSPGNRQTKRSKPASPSHELPNVPGSEMDIDSDAQHIQRRKFYRVMKKRYKGRENVEMHRPTSFKSYYFYGRAAANEFVRRDTRCKREEMEELLNEEGLAEYDDTNWEWTYRKEIKVVEEELEIIADSPSTCHPRDSRSVKVYRGGSIYARDWKQEESQKDQLEMKKLKKLGLLSPEAEALFLRIFKREETIECTGSGCESSESEVDSESTARWDPSDEEEKGYGKE